MIYRLSDPTGIVVTLTGHTQDQALAAGDALCAALARRVDITPATPIPAGPDAVVLGWSTYPGMTL
jgi:hypothetical protein